MELSPEQVAKICDNTAAPHKWLLLCHVDDLGSVSRQVKRLNLPMTALMEPVRGMIQRGEPVLVAVGSTLQGVGSDNGRPSVKFMAEELKTYLRYRGRF